RLQDSFYRRRDEEVDVVLRQLSLEIQLDRADPPAEQLHVQCGQAFGQVGEGSQVDELFRRQGGGVDGKSRQVAGEHGSHLFRNVKCNGDLSFRGQRPDVRCGDEIGQ